MLATEWGGIKIEGRNSEINSNEIYLNNNYGILLGKGTSFFNCKIIGNHIHKNLGGGIIICGFWDGVGKNIEISNNNIKFNIGVGIKLIHTISSTIENNNICYNMINAKFINSFGNKWDENYWSPLHRIIKIVIGAIKPFYGFPAPLIGRFFIPMINIDWNPAQEPYDIEV